MTYNLKCIKQRISVLLSSFFLSSSAWAKSTNSNQIEGVLRAVTDLITSGVGTGLCTLAIIGVGFSWVKLGKLEKEQAISVILGIGVIYSAAYISTKLGV